MIRTGSRVSERGTVEAQLESWAQKLHDLSGRNRLLYYHETGASSAAIEQPPFDALFQLLVERGQPLRVPVPRLSDVAKPAPPAGAPGPLADVQELQELIPDSGGFDAGPLEDEVPATTPQFLLPSGPRTDYAGAGRKSGSGNPGGRTGRSPKRNEILTNHSVAQLNRVMYNLRYAARTIQEEQGLNILYVTFGMLRWRDLHSISYSRAPLILVPIRLERDRPNSPYLIRMADDDIVVNPVLQVKLMKDFGLQFPEVANDLSRQELRQFIEHARNLVADLEGWEVTEKATLGAFSFLTLLLIKDFENHAPLYAKHPLVRWLSGFEAAQSVPAEPPPSASELDTVVDPGGVYQILDADSSQQEAIEAAKRGLSFVLQGPPGTGKSQTIANLVAESIMAGKRVLFVSQKMAALEVVQNRLARRGLGEFCLEIHSHRMDKRKVVGQLMASLAGDAVRVGNPTFAAEKREVREIRQQLNTYVRELHEPRPELGLSIYELQGRLSQLLDAPELDFTLPEIETVSAPALAQMLGSVRELAGYAEILKTASADRWKGFNGAASSIEERERTGKTMEATSGALASLHALVQANLVAYGLAEPENLQGVLDFAHVLTCFSPEVLSQDYEGPVLRFRGRGLSDGQFLSIQYGSDADKIQTVLRKDRQPSTRDMSMAISTLAQAIRKGRDRHTPRRAHGSLNEVDPSALEDLLRTVEHGYADARRLFSEAEMPPVLRDLYSQPAVTAAEWFSDHGSHAAELQELAEFSEARRLAVERGLEDFVRKALHAGLPAEEFDRAFSRRFYELLIDKLIGGIPALGRFRGRTHADLINRFRRLDTAMIDRSAGEIKSQLYRRKPERSWMNAASAETSILRREYNKRRRLKPLRRLFAEIPNLIQTLKPCLMMSPLTVCQLLDPAIHEFDLAVFDEASQIPPEYAVSAFLRAKQVIIAGDRQQLPPMNFFQTMDGEEPEEDDGQDEAEFESILTLADSRGFPNKMLNWHYRSKDESLIAYSNYHFYENRLFTFPNSRMGNPSTGLKFVYVPEGVYQPGEGARHNIREANRVAELALEHLAERPGLSLGVVAFSAPQRRAIETAIDALRMRKPELNTLLDGRAREPLFIKNLENVQGDERDVIILSVGYGRDERGRFALNFGPLNRDGGARRLNVAITRARHLLYLVASVQPEDIDLSRAASQGASLLRDYLTTARDGVRAIAQASPGSDGDDSETLFEEAVQTELTKRGLDVARRVGASQYRVDLAVRDPADPGSFLLGLECDGPMYRSGLTARDRDRLRQQVLEGLGWNIHRIWSRDWIRDREGEIRRILELLDSARTRHRPPSPTKSGAKPSTDTRGTPTGNLTAPVDAPSVPPSAAIYHRSEVARTGAMGRAAFLGAPLSEVVDALQALVNAEGPIAVEVAKKATAKSWRTRLDPETGERLDGALKAGLAQGAFRLNGSFLWPMGLRVAPLRVHAAGQPRRRIEEIAPEEIAQAMCECVKGAVTIKSMDLVREAAKLFGLKVTPSNSESLERILQELLSGGVLKVEDGRIGKGTNFEARRG